MSFKRPLGHSDSSAPGSSDLLDMEGFHQFWSPTNISDDDILSEYHKPNRLQTQTGSSESGLASKRWPNSIGPRDLDNLPKDLPRQRPFDTPLQAILNVPTEYPLNSMDLQRLKSEDSGTLAQSFREANIGPWTPLGVIGIEGWIYGKVDGNDTKPDQTDSGYYSGTANDCTTFGGTEVPHVIESGPETTAEQTPSSRQGDKNKYDLDDWVGFDPDAATEHVSRYSGSTDNTSNIPRSSATSTRKIFHGIQRRRRFTEQEKEHIRLVRRLGACSICRKKKVKV